MIPRISPSVQNNQTVAAQPNFKGGPVDLVLAGLQLCETAPMLNVTVADLSTAIIPRTVIEAQTNPFAGLEAFRRESSGLIINCLIPGFIVAGIAKLLSRPTMGGKSNMSGCWANEDTLKLVCDHWKGAKGSDDAEKAADSIRNILKGTKGVDGKNEVVFSKFTKDGKFGKDIETHITNLADGIVKKSNDNDLKTLSSNLFNEVLKNTHAAENIKMGADKEYFSQGLGAVIENTPKILRELLVKQAEAPDKAVEEIIKDFSTRATKLVTRKSLLGLGVIIPLGIAAQPINRWVTEKTSGKKGAPIYKDFAQSQVKEPTSKEKAALARQKMVSVASIIGVALFSIMKKPSKAMFKNVTQFKGIFPSMDQTRIISTATFASRMMSSQDKNDLRESTFRDIATFSSFYLIGDYVAKGIASAIEKFNKNDVKLINDLKPLDSNEKNVLKKVWHWTKNTTLKSTDEIYASAKNGQMDAKAIENATKYAKKMRGLCQLGNLGFSLLALGVIIPNMYRKKTNKEHEKELTEKA